ncbi:MAG: hypothetical protein JNJ54_30390 [Myxococcaceae bacterium]|nr:hypothetical protein [Myxococcaceae bacterium]
MGGGSAGGSAEGAAGGNPAGGSAGGIGGGRAGGSAAGGSGGGSGGGGSGGVDAGSAIPDGGYPSADRWAAMSQVGHPGARVEQVMVWSGAEVLLWGGTAQSGFAWTPANDTWRPLATVGQPEGYRRTDGVWTGTELIIWGGGSSAFGNAAYQQGGARYDPGTNQWRAMNLAGAPSPRWLHRLAWTGSEVMVFGGYGLMPDGGSENLGDGALYNPVSDSWRPLPASGAPAPRHRPEMVRAGDEVIIWGGSAAQCLNDGARFNVTTNTWAPMTTTGAPTICGFVWTPAATAWTGSDLLVFGGYTGDPQVGGHRYTPATDAWSTLPRGDPCDRNEASAVWTGSELITWGGAVYAGCPVPYGMRRGYRYRPATNTWAPMSLTNAPSQYERVSAVWTGREVVFYGARAVGGAGIDFSARYFP